MILGWVFGDAFKFVFYFMKTSADDGGGGGGITTLLEASLLSLILDTACFVLVAFVYVNLETTRLKEQWGVGKKADKGEGVEKDLEIL